MKKIIIYGILFIELGFIIGSFLFENNQKLIEEIFKADTYYFLQEGVYKNKNIMMSNLSLNNIVIEKENEEYYVYVGITKDYEVAKKIKNLYEKKDYKVYLKEKEFISSEFSNNIDQLDLLIKKTDDEDKILIIEEIALSNYIKNKNN